MSFFSIIVPIFNGEKYLNKCIDSILNQDFNDFELILVNDGSTDKSYSICLDYKNKDSRIIIIDKENSGANSSRKIASELATGKYAVFVDCDDTIKGGYLSFAYSIISKYKPDMIYFCDNDYSKLQKGLYCDEKLNDVRSKFVYDKNGRGFNNGSISFTLWSKIILMTIYQNAQKDISDKVVYGEDMLCVGSCLKKIKSMYVSELEFYNYELTPCSVMRTFNYISFSRYDLTVDEMRKMRIVPLNSIYCFGFIAFYNILLKLAATTNSLKEFKNVVNNLHCANLWECVNKISIKNNSKSFLKIFLLRRKKWGVIYKLGKRITDS